MFRTEEGNKVKVPFEFISSDGESEYCSECLEN